MVFVKLYYLVTFVVVLEQKATYEGEKLPVADKFFCDRLRGEIYSATKPCLNSFSSLWFFSLKESVYEKIKNWWNAFSPRAGLNFVSLLAFCDNQADFEPSK